MANPNEQTAIIAPKIEQHRFVDTAKIAKSNADFYHISAKTDINKTKTPNPKKSLLSKHLRRLRELLSMKRPRLQELDEAMNALLMDNNITRNDKIYGLWDILTEVGLKSPKSEYLLDSLSTLMPIELTDELIGIYGDLEDNNIKAKLIRMIADNLNIANPEKQSKAELDFIIQKSMDIQSFLKEHILSEQDGKMFSEFLDSYAQISDERDTQDMLANLRENSDSLPINQADLAHILAQTSISTKQAQREILPTMLEDMQNASPDQQEQKKEFDKAILEGIDAGVLDAQSQDTVAQYLKNQEPPLTPQDKNLNTDDLSDYYQWAKVNAKIKSNETTLAQMVSQSDNPLKVSAILLYANEDDITNIKSKQNTQEIYQKLQTSLENNNYPKETAVIIKDAMKRLKER